MSVIVDGTKQAVLQQVAAATNRTIRSGLTTVAGNLLGINTQFSGPELGPSQPRARRKISPFQLTQLSYPPEVGEDVKQGHYILFFINKYDKAAIKARADAMSGLEMHEKAILAQYKAEKKFSKGGGSYLGYKTTGQGIGRPRTIEEVRADYIQMHVIDGYKNNSRFGGGEPLTTQGAVAGSNARPDSQSIQLRYPGTQRIDTTISLYMPPSVSVRYGQDYTDSNIGFAASIGAGIIQDMRAGTEFTTEKVEDVVGEIGSAATKGILALLDVIAPGSKAMAQIVTGRAITPKMELMFNGTGRREFSYEFTFIPKSTEEAIIVERIVKQFKFHMSADFIEGTGFREMELPSTFDIQYMHQAGRNTHLHKISTCILEEVNVTYGGDRFQTHADGVPQKTTLSLKFKEMEIITKSRIDDGY